MMTVPTSETIPNTNSSNFSLELKFITAQTPNINVNNIETMTNKR